MVFQSRRGLVTEACMRQELKVFLAFEMSL